MPWNEYNSDSKYMNADQYPLVSIVTPSFNMARFLDETIQSVLAQDYPNIEYIVIDGGSTDSTLTILEKYKSRLRYDSGPDGGAADAINRGFRMSHGAIFAYLNCRRYLPPGSSHYGGTPFALRPSRYDSIWRGLLGGTDWVRKYRNSDSDRRELKLLGRISIRGYAIAGRNPALIDTWSGRMQAQCWLAAGSRSYRPLIGTTPVPQSAPQSVSYILLYHPGRRDFPGPVGSEDLSSWSLPSHALSSSDGAHTLPASWFAPRLIWLVGNRFSGH